MSESLFGKDQLTLSLFLKEWIALFKWVNHSFALFVKSDMSNSLSSLFFLFQKAKKCDMNFLSPVVIFPLLKRPNRSFIKSLLLLCLEKRIEWSTHFAVTVLFKRVTRAKERIPYLKKYTWSAAIFPFLTSQKGLYIHFTPPKCPCWDARD